MNFPLKDSYLGKGRIPKDQHFCLHLKLKTLLLYLSFCPHFFHAYSKMFLSNNYTISRILISQLIINTAI